MRGHTQINHMEKMKVDNRYIKNIKLTSYFLNTIKIKTFIFGP